jgi:amino acid transporter
MTAERTETEAVVAAASVAPGRDQPTRLKGNMGVGELVMTVLAFSAPLTTVAGFIPALFTFSGKTAPAIYILVTVLLLTFSVGFTAMARTVPNPGGFYAFVTAGLGRSSGLGGAFLAAFGYMAIGYFGPSLFAVTLKAFLEPLGFPVIAWYWYGLVMVLITTSLAYRRIDLSAKLLTGIMALEIGAVVIFDVAAFIHGGPADGGGAHLALPSVSDSGLGVAILFILGNFLGFEATVIYREEVKDPVRTIPRAVYSAVAGIGVFYAIAAWAFIAYFGADRVTAAAEADMAGLFTSTMIALVGSVVSDIVTVLLITSMLAAMLSIHNASSRYLFSMGTDGVLPSALGKVHPRHGSPFVSALVVGSVWVVLTIVFAITGVAPDGLYAKASGAGTLAIMIVMFAASIAVVVYFWKRRGLDTDVSVWKTLIAPALSALGMGGVTWLAVSNYSELLGDTGAVTTTLLVFTFGLPVLGFIYARILRVRKPEVYLRIGRQHS